MFALEHKLYNAFDAKCMAGVCMCSAPPASKLETLFDETSRLVWVVMRQFLNSHNALEKAGARCLASWLALV